MKMPRIIPEDKANHRVRGSQVAALFSVIVMPTATLMHLPMVAVLALGAVAAIGSAAVAGVLVERMQAKENAVSAAHGGQPLHTIEKADIVATAWGSWPVAAVLFLAAVLKAAGT